MVYFRPGRKGVPAFLNAVLSILESLYMFSKFGLLLETHLLFPGNTRFLKAFLGTPLFIPPSWIPGAHILRSESTMQVRVYLTLHQYTERIWEMPLLELPCAKGDDIDLQLPPLEGQGRWVWRSRSAWATQGVPVFSKKEKTGYLYYLGMGSIPRFCY